MDHLKVILEYCSLGYDVTPTVKYGKDMIRMTKRYSYKSERAIHCEQIFDHEKMYDINNLKEILNWMYENIQEQENTGEFYEMSDG